MTAPGLVPGCTDLGTDSAYITKELSTFTKTGYRRRTRDLGGLLPGITTRLQVSHIITVVIEWSTHTKAHTAQICVFGLS